ncbi:DUF3375 domain-containing protein [Williamsia sterculiae]|uniref:Uncharacterized protein n=1 Tax=Williamsia sterculiae TaxID=1344003 RepID=A0A1N7H9A6_9NOCA|nr:DUF3375 domain-containing protein [Williamsia sterculiae]SIS21402.1 Protein of unknown function [Williamsia sterculiae]
MSRSTAAEFFTDFAESADGDVTLRLLRSRNAVVHLSIMAARLGDGQVAGDLLTAQVQTDIDQLAEHWTDRGFTPPGATDLLDRWVKDGFVSRTLDPVRDVDRYHLTRGATSAIAQIQAVRRDRSVATETVMEMVVGRLGDVAVAINPDPGEHIRDIDAKIADLRRRRDELAAGALPAVDRRRVLDDIRMVSSLAERMPADIIGYGERLRQNSRALLIQGADDSTGGYAEALNRLFDGYDELAQSPQGKAFDAFYGLIADHRMRQVLEQHIEDIVAGIPDLPDDLVETLTGFIDRMWAEVQRVDEVRGQVYRRINTFVKEGDVLHHRVLREQIAAAQKAAAAAFERVAPTRDIGIPVPFSTVDTASVGALAFHDGVIELPDVVHDTGGEMVIDPAALMAVESIDWQSLTEAVNLAVDAGDGPTGLADVLAVLPGARAGDVVGVWSLALRHGEVDEVREVTVLAHTAAGAREMRLPAMTFSAPLPDAPVSAPAAVHLLDGLTGAPR